MAQLILVRHGKSLWNIDGRWTGLTDISLADEGRKEAQEVGNATKDIPIDVAFTSVLKRATETLAEILAVRPSRCAVIQNPSLNERDYGDLTGKNKWELQKEFGDARFRHIRRGWNVPIPNGETLQDVYNRVIPYYKQTILPYLEKNQNVLIVAHGNSLRALAKYLENISDEDISTVEIAPAEVYIYTVDNNGTVVSKDIRLFRKNTV